MPVCIENLRGKCGEKKLLSAVPQTYLTTEFSFFSPTECHPDIHSIWDTLSKIFFEDLLNRCKINIKLQRSYFQAGSSK